MRGDGSIYRRGNRWWLCYHVNGKLKREPARVVDRNGALQPARTPVEANRALKRKRDEIGAHRLGVRPIDAQPAKPKVTVSDLLDGLLNHLETRKAAGARGGAWSRTLRAHSKPLRTFFAGTLGADVTTEDLERYQRERLALLRAPATVNRELEGLRRAYRYAAGLKPARFPVTEIPFIQMLPVENVRTGYFERAEIEAVIANLRDEAVRDFVEWGWLTGMRKGEIAQLTWSMINTRGTPWMLHVPGPITKNRKPRDVQLVGRLRAVIERRLKARRLDTPLVFHRMAAGRDRKLRVAAMTDIRKAWRNAATGAKLQGRHFHDLRRSAVRNLIRAGVDPSVAMKVSGHRTRSMLDRYNIVAAEETGQALQKLDAYLDAQPVDQKAR